MTNERPQDKWLAPDTAAQLRTYSAQRMKGVWFRVAWSGALLVLFAVNLTHRLEDAQRNDTTTSLAVITAIVLLRFGYYVWRLISARRDVEAMKRSLGIMA
jgi:hypothetical protein